MFEYVGNLHVHSHHSDGRRSIEDISKIAAMERLDFIGINDHNDLKGLRECGEGWRNGVLVLVRAVQPNEGDPQKVIDEVRQAGGIGFMAHPHDRGSPFASRGRVFTWDDWSVTGYTGISVWCHSSGWKGTATNVFTAIHNYYRHRWTFTGPYPETLAAFDAESRRRHISLIGSSDAHEFEVGRKPFRLLAFPYAVSFRAVNMHLVLRQALTGDDRADRSAVLAALAAGNGFVGYDALRNSRGFRFSAVGGDAYAGMGDEIKLREGITLRVKSPVRGLIRIVHDGAGVLETVSDTATYQVKQPGVYRAEIMSLHKLHRPRPWIFANPIYVR
jgi:hypothetical protein